MSLYPSYPPNLTAEQLSYLITSFTDYSLSHGLIVRPAPTFIPTNPSNSLATPAPVTLWPSPFPRTHFEEARSLQPFCNLLYARVAADQSWLGDLSTSLSLVDDFISKLWAIHTRLKSENGYHHKYSLGLFRSDYMVHTSDSEFAPLGIRQVEFNTIASSFGALASKVSELHRYLWRSGAYPPTADYINDLSLPRNEALERLAEGLAKAHEVYIQDVSPDAKYTLETAASVGPNSSYGIMFVIQDGERNAFDQRWLEYHLTQKYGIRVFRVTFEEIRKYTHHLAGSKKVQQVLAEKKNLEKFIGNERGEEGIAERIFETFAAIYPMDESEAGLKARKLAFEEPHRFVLKPQREGGGNNIYKDKIPEFLRGLEEEKWQGYILMELIRPPEVENLVMRNGEMMQGKVVGELGVYGAVVWKDAEDGEPGDIDIVYNEEAGVLLRTKGSSSEEGGVAAGFGCVDSCVLVD
ncbi:hypothetical protein TWF191_006206 [Orbilia oligospora]|uniref:Glutathione synthetase n=1 Tax=Orbilia oligospora TaxID=2813651 RepID=A0A7C8UNT2_ORBOL|nr:hypothetical protein TWF191_006206 [Orbilia oligospora]